MALCIIFKQLSQSSPTFIPKPQNVPQMFGLAPSAYLPDFSICGYKPCAHDEVQNLREYSLAVILRVTQQYLQKEYPLMNE